MLLHLKEANLTIDSVISCVTMVLNAEVSYCHIKQEDGHLAL
jgi:hypothetical protein